MRARADLILFWVADDMTMTTACEAEAELNLSHETRRCLYGRSSRKPGFPHLDAYWAGLTGKAPHSDLKAMVEDAIALIGQGEARTGAERDIPLPVWRSDPFSKWYKALTSAGHRLRGFRVLKLLAFGDRDPRAPVAGFLASAAIEVAGEGRIKSNEAFIARPDNVAVVPLFDPGGPEGEAFLVREYRLAARNGAGLALSVPEGSAPGSSLPSRAVAVRELSEEIGLSVAPERLIELMSRQSMPTLSSHHTRLFALELTEDEAILLRRAAAEGRVLGADSEERIGILRQSLAEPMHPSLDWTSIGLIETAKAELLRKRGQAARTGKLRETAGYRYPLDSRGVKSSRRYK
ncbi:MAG: hypothetical protein WAN43_00785 [Rhodomicrobium sp.]